MHYQWLISVFLKNTSRDQLLQKAYLFLAKFETDTLSRAPYEPHTWWRYIDDIFMIWTHSVDDLHAFTSYLNSIHPIIKFTSNYSFTSIPFLDVNVFVDNGNITTGLYTKATDKHQYSLHSSCHPQHTKRAIPFSLALRLRRIYSSDETFKQRSIKRTQILPQQTRI